MLIKGAMSIFASVMQRGWEETIFVLIAVFVFIWICEKIYDFWKQRDEK
jgi:hypothetical protein